MAQGVAVWLGGCALSAVAGWPASPEVVIVGAATIAGAVLLPDADHRSGTLAHVAWPVSRWLCDKIADVSAWTYRATGTSYDRWDGDRRGDGHRTLTHTVLAALVAGVVAGLFAGLVPYGPAVLAGAMVACAAQAVLPATRVRPVERWRRRLRVSGLWLGARVLRAVGRLARRVKRVVLVWPLGGCAGVVVYADHAGGWWLGLVVAAGWLVHLVGDACTEQGVPAWWPLAVRGQRWRMVGLWSPLRIHTGGRAENAYTVVAVVLALAGSGWLIIT